MLLMSDTPPPTHAELCSFILWGLAQREKPALARAEDIRIPADLPDDDRRGEKEARRIHIAVAKPEESPRPREGYITEAIVHACQREWPDVPSEDVLNVLMALQTDGRIRTAPDTVLGRPCNVWRIRAETTQHATQPGGIPRTFRDAGPGAEHSRLLADQLLKKMQHEQPAESVPTVDGPEPAPEPAPDEKPAAKQEDEARSIGVGADKQHEDKVPNE